MYDAETPQTLSSSQIAIEQSRSGHLVEKCYEFNVPAIYCFIDYSNNVKQNLLQKIFQKMGVPEYLILLIRSLSVPHNTAYAKIDKELSNIFHIGKGLRQGVYFAFYTSIFTVSRSLGRQPRTGRMEYEHQVEKYPICATLTTQLC